MAIDNDEPLIPKSPLGTAMVVGLISSVFALLGWFGTRILSMDENVVILNRLVDNVQSEINEHHKDRIKLSEDVVRLEEDMKFLKEKIEEND